MNVFSVLNSINIIVLTAYQSDGNWRTYLSVYFKNIFIILIFSVFVGGYTFIFIFGVLAYLLKREYWRDIH